MANKTQGVGVMVITIVPATNGATVTVDQEEDGMIPINTVYKFEGDDAELGLSGLVSMLYDIVESIGEPGGKYSRERMDIRLQHGHAYECKAKDCVICKGDGNV